MTVVPAAFLCGIENAQTPQLRHRALDEALLTFAQFCSGSVRALDALAVAGEAQPALRHLGGRRLKGAVEAMRDDGSQ